MYMCAFVYIVFLGQSYSQYKVFLFQIGADITSMIHEVA